MKVGRNDPCPCGSGKKYKKCCLAKDEAAAREATAKGVEAERVVASSFEPPSPLPAPPPPPAPRPPEPMREARDALWDEFEQATPAEQITIFQRVLAEPDLLDEEYAYEMLSEIREHSNPAEFAGLLQALRDQHPNFYEHDEKYYLEWQIADALTTGNLTALPELGTALAELAGQDLDIFYSTLDRLAYYGQLTLIADMMRRAWPLVRASDKFVPWADSEFARSARDITLFAYVEQTGDPHADDPELINALELFGPIYSERVAIYLALLTGQDKRVWTLDDFAFPKPARRKQDDEEEVDPAYQNLADLALAFLGELYRVEGVSLAKGNLARESITRYVVRRHEGELEPGDSPLDRLARPKAPKRAPVHRPITNPLCPDRATLDRFLGGMLDFFSLGLQYYKAAATLELVPAWLRFLENHGLLTSTERAATLEDLRRLVAEARPIWEPHTAVLDNIQRAWEQDS